MKIKIYTDHKRKSAFARKASQEYCKRISRFAKVEFLPLSRYGQEPALLVSPTGRDLNSVELSGVISDFMMRTSDLSILTADVPDLPDNVKIRLTTIELSADTGLILLLEQVFRAFKIMDHEAYHK